MSRKHLAATALFTGALSALCCFLLTKHGALPSTEITHSYTTQPSQRPHTSGDLTPEPARGIATSATRAASVPKGFLAVFMDRSAGEKRLPPDISDRLKSISEPEEFTAVEGLLLDATEDDAIRNEAANLLRRSQSTSLPYHLITVLDRSGDNPRFRSFAAQHLGISLTEGDPSTAPAIAQRLRDALHDRDLPVRREALLALSRAHDDSVNDILLNGLDSKDWFGARDLIIRLIYQSNIGGRLAEIRKLLYDGDESVSIAAIYVVGEWRDAESQGPLKALSRSSSLRISNAASVALRKIEAQTSGNRILGPHPDH